MIFINTIVFYNSCLNCLAAGSKVMTLNFVNTIVFYNSCLKHSLRNSSWDIIDIIFIRQLLMEHGFAFS